MNDDMMSVIESQANTNGLLIAALGKAHEDLRSMRNHLASIKGEELAKLLSGPQTDQSSAPAEIRSEDTRTVIHADSQSEGLPTIPEDSSPYPDTLLPPQLYAKARELVAQLPENNAVFADRKWRLNWLVRTIYNRLAESLSDYVGIKDEKQEAQDLAEYQRSQARQYQSNWEELSKSCRLFAAHFNRDGMNEVVRDQLDDMLSKCEVASHNT